MVDAVRTLYGRSNAANSPKMDSLQQREPPRSDKRPLSREGVGYGR